MKRILSVVVAVAASTAGHIVLWINGATFSMLMQQRFEPSPLAIVGITVGVLLVGVAMLTIAWSSFGVLVVGTLHVLAGLTVGLPPVLSPSIQISRGLMRISRELSYGMDYTVLTGVLLLTGAIFVAAGLVARRGRIVGASATARAGAAAAAIVVGAAGLLIGLTAGFLNFRRVFAFMAGIDPVAFALLLLGALLLAAATLSMRWSVIGVITLGALVILAGILEATVRFMFMLPRIAGLPESFGSAALLGNVQLIGVLLIAAGVGVWLRARRGAAASTVLAPGEPAPVV
jgi:hypothetical protein